jgi:hypothetical protein
MIVIFLDSYFGLDIYFCSLHPSQTNKIATINNPKLISPMGGLDAGTLVKSSSRGCSGVCESLIQLGTGVGVSRLEGV